MVITPLLPQERVKTTFLHAEYERCGIPVYELSYRQWKKDFLHLTNEDYNDPEEFMGAYYNGPFDNDHKNHPNRFIVLNKAMNNSWRLSVLYHELGHHSCVISRCSCAKHGFVYRQTELHAELAAIYLAHHRGFPQMAFNCLCESVLDLDHPKFLRIRNATMIVKHPVFIEAKNGCNTMFKSWLDEKKNSHIKERYLNAIVDDSTRQCRWTPNRYLRKFAGASAS